MKRQRAEISSNVISHIKSAHPIEMRRSDKLGIRKISRGKFPRFIFSLIPSLFERYISIGCADLIWDITLDEISALCLFIGRGPLLLNNY